ncbi:FkbM family methyltransferase [Chitinophagaceae bacterium LB-8]|uniref:FkbM family methyltransferase n=1 Tax=Paraflavisolibacter caeni TaxID=2982496 RepID=A0A9X2XVM6_9BACT|nr:FkbM family methyltransferase [Paraflavisolibacter caeni]MCU7549655.1 FkbM family methyltransferase [Paraflavisolibacter caeni]
MEGRVKDFFSKLFFCIKVSGSIETLFTLILNSKRFSKFCNSEIQHFQGTSESPNRYLFNHNGKRRNIFLRTFSGDIGIFYEVFWRRVYHVPHLDWKDFKCIVDVGANVGMTALFFGTLSPKAQIIAIEPDPDNFDLLLRNTENDSHISRLTVVHAAVAETDGFLSFEKARLAYNTRVIDDYNGSRVKSLSLNTLIRNHCFEKVDLVKIDIEGFEHRLFEGNTEWLDLVQNLIIEIHSQENFSAFSHLVTNSGFSIRKLSRDTEVEGIYWASRDFSLSNLIGHGN